MVVETVAIVAASVLVLQLVGLIIAIAAIVSTITK